MAAPVRLAALRQKFLNFQNGKVALGTIHRGTSSLRDGRGATDGQPPAVGQSARGPRRELRLPPRRCASQGDGGRQRSRPRHPWDFKMSPLLSQTITAVSLVSFMLYFFVFREESDVDTAIYRPIWERVPDISPDVAERMMEFDRQLGIYYDRTEWDRSLAEYKERYYREHPDQKPQ